jgi:hypothetical protein
MALKTKVIAFVPESNMFIGQNFDNNCETGIITFQDDSPYTAKAYELTEQALKDDKGYQLLNEICKTDLGVPRHYLFARSHKAKTEIWTILWHKFLIEALENDGWTILPAPEWEDLPTNLSENAMVI